LEFCSVTIIYQLKSGYLQFARTTSVRSGILLELFTKLERLIRVVENPVLFIRVDSP